jgi:hypothetical protein
MGSLRVLRTGWVRAVCASPALQGVKRISARNALLIWHSLGQPAARRPLSVPLESHHGTIA